MPGAVTHQYEDRRERARLLASLDGVDFDGAWEKRVESVIDAATGLRAFFISSQDLIASKLAAGRTRDLAGVEEIREAQASAKKRSGNDVTMLL